MLARNTFNQLRAASDPSLAQLFDYFEDQWLHRTPVTLWNVFHAQLRTNKDLEGWHTRFNAIVKTHHPNIWQLVTALQQEQDATDITINQVIAGIVVRRRNRRYEQIEKRICTITHRYDRGEIDVIEFLTGVSHNLACYN
jgi:hypothetical protein